MGPHRDFYVHISGPARPHAGTTLPSEPDALTGFDALGDLDVQCSRLFSHSPVGADHRLLQRNLAGRALEDRKSTRLNSSHVAISYAVFCLKKKKNMKTLTT